MDSRMADGAISTPKADFYIRYTARDAILYALSIGFGSTDADYEHDLRYLYEDHDDFQVAPMFGLTLIFWATQDNNLKNATTLAIPPFPPPMMKAMQVIPKAFLCPPLADSLATLQDCPVLHMFQSIELHRPLPVPRKVNGRHTIAELRLQGKLHSIQPKSIGTFVTTELAVSDDTSSSGQAICTLQSTALVFGMPADQVLPYQNNEAALSSSPSLISNKRDSYAVFWFETPPILIDSNQALWYRMASGDSNRIHVDPSALPPMLFSPFDEKDDPDAPKSLLHGLCTLGVAGRVILQRLAREYNNKNSSSSIRDGGGSSSNKVICLQRLQGAFAKPIFVQDEIVIKVWKQQQPTQQYQEQYAPPVLLEMYFEVHNATRNEIAIRDGFFVAQISYSLPARL